jgi:ParB family chromosome partitioning protein
MKRGLGKGLDALMGEASQIEQKDGVLEVDIFLLDNNKDQPRKEFNEEKLEELAQSISVHGIMQPILVYEDNGRYTIVAGERRFRAAKIAGLKKVPVIVREYTDREILELSLIENIQREDLNAMEQAVALEQLTTQYKLRQEDVAQRVGKSRSAIANLMRLNGLPENVKQMIRNGQLSAGHARCLIPLSDEGKIHETAMRICAGGFSVRQAEQLVKKIMESEDAKKAKKVKQKQAPVEIRQAQDQLSSALDTKVKIHGNLERGRITIDYYNKQQLEQIYDYLTKE